MKKTVAFFVLLFALIFSLLCISCRKKEKVMIWTSGEDYKNDYILSELRAKFPQYDIELEYATSSSIAAKILEEKDKTSCDIICSEEYGYLDMCSDYLAQLDDFDYSPFLDQIIPASRKWTPELKNGGCIILNPAVLKEKKLNRPTSYADLLKPEYKNLISMPNPSTSGTGYMFLLSLVNAYGEEKAFEYFKNLTKNILHYTSSGSGPVNDIKAGEVAIGLGMTSQAITEKNQGVDLEVVFFEEGSPYSMYGNAIVKKSYKKESVREVFNYLSTAICKGCNEKFFPDQIYKDFVPEIANYPKKVKDADMNNDTLTRKKALQSKWSFT